ncbi:multi-sensor hybrid histidine kinase [Enterobacter cloacae]|uniref:Multi-sensor hybrid histidine kinase n=1 Tax=Enterobacter cloacae TaxID=550 RepID=A0A377LUB8_ENTCL|nr:multi-sensor hybrid histidine kinase [Enterobacter cloacae]
MLVAFLPEIRNKVEEQLVGENPEELLQAIHKLHGKLWLQRRAPPEKPLPAAGAAATRRDTRI